MRKFSLIISIIIVLISSYLYIMKNHYWYYPAVIGVWLFFDYLSYLRKNKTTLDLLIKKQYKTFIKLYLALSLLGILIEIIGMLLLKFWYYNYLSKLTLIIGIILFYPFILMSFREIYNLIKSFVLCPIFSTILAMILGIIIWEIPNIYSKDWIYTVPYITYEIVHINIVIIILWVFLIQGPVFVYRILKIK